MVEQTVGRPVIIKLHLDTGAAGGRHGSGQQAQVVRPAERSKVGAVEQRQGKSDEYAAR